MNQTRRHCPLVGVWYIFAYLHRHQVILKQMSETLKVLKCTVLYKKKKTKKRLVIFLRFFGKNRVRGMSLSVTRSHPDVRYQKVWDGMFVIISFFESSTSWTNTFEGDEVFSIYISSFFGLVILRNISLRSLLPPFSGETEQRQVTPTKNSDNTLIPLTFSPAILPSLLFPFRFMSLINPSTSSVSFLTLLVFEV